MSPASPHRSTVRTKTVATVGPACQQPELLRKLVEKGVDVFRINMAHGTREEHDRVVSTIRRVATDLEQAVGILVDLAGPKIRLGKLVQDPLTCRPGDRFRLVSGRPEEPHELTCSYETLIEEIQPGDRVLLADGTISMQVVAKQGDSVELEVDSPGELRSNQGINLPGVSLKVPALTEEDRDNAVWASGRPVDFVSLSFVRTPQEVRELKDLLRKHRSQALVIAKIEKREALDDLDNIIRACDGIMVARGDLGVEIDVAETPVVQKRIIAACRKHCKPVIVATQMLDSMQHSRRPTRAEATDVANAILDGADACMLSGETAIGQYPVETVEMMNRIMHVTEQMLFDRPAAAVPEAELAGVHPITAAVVAGAGLIAKNSRAKLVVVATRSGATARVKSKQREFVHTIGISNSETTLRRMCLYWGIEPIRVESMEDHAQMRARVAEWGRAHGLVKAGDRIVFVTGSDLVPGAHNVVVVHEVE